MRRSFTHSAVVVFIILAASSVWAAAAPPKPSPASVVHSLAGTWSLNANGYEGWVDFTTRKFFIGIEETIQNYSYNASTGVVTFLRPSCTQRYTGKVSGNKITGTFTSDGATFDWTATRQGPAPAAPAPPAAPPKPSPASPAPPAAPPKPSPATSLLGKWSGQWSNSMGERGADSLELRQDSGGELHGVWSSYYEGKWSTLYPSGRCLNATQFRLEARTSTRLYKIEGQLDGATLVLKYQATRLNGPGGYSGESHFTRAR